MRNHTAHVADTTRAEDTAPAQADGSAEAQADGPDTAPPAPGRGRHAAEMRRLYAADWVAFVAWCRAAGLAALPAAPNTVAAYLGSLSAVLKPGALARRAAAIADRHQCAGHASPGTDPAVRAALRAARSARDAVREAKSDAPAVPPPVPPVPPARRQAPPGPAQLARMAARCPGDLSGLRDRALLLLVAAGLDAERLLALNCEHVRFTAEGAVLAGTDLGAGAREEVALARRASGASAACSVRALQDWLNRSDTRFGPVFRKVDRWGNVEHRRLRPDALPRIWRRRAVMRRSRRGGRTAP